MKELFEYLVQDSLSATSQQPKIVIANCGQTLVELKSSSNLHSLGKFHEGVPSKGLLVAVDNRHGAHGWHPGLVHVEN